MHPVHSPLTVAGALLADHSRRVLDGPEMRQLAARFPSTAHLGTVPWNPEAVEREAKCLWADACAAVDPVFSELAERELGASLPSFMQTLSTLRFLLWLWRPGAQRTAAGTFDLGLVFLCHWDAAHRAAFLAWAETGLAGPTGPSEVSRSGGP